MSSAVRIAATAGSPTTRVATGIGPSVRARRRGIGLPPARPICCRSATFIWSSRCTMTLAPDEFIRRFLLHVLSKGFHRIRHYGLLASATCKANIARATELIAAPVAVTDPPAEHDADLDASAA